jgi:hypothetical protein
MSWSSQWSLSFWLSHQYPIRIALLPHSCYMPRPSHPSWLDYFNYTWRRVQVMKLLNMNNETYIMIRDIETLVVAQPSNKFYVFNGIQEFGKLSSPAVTENYEQPRDSGPHASALFLEGLFRCYFILYA